MKMLTGALIGLVLLGGCSTGQTASPAPTVTVTVPGPSVPLPGPTVTVPVPAPAVTVTAPPPQASGVVGDGVWTVGEDIAPGTYVTVVAVSGECSWAITKSGSNGQEAVAVGFPGGGKPRVTLKAGQDFSSSDCGEWTPA
jgi:hypothetical protein